jgi:hypothetical protein
VSEFDFICVSGYGKSGSGACIDILKEFDHIDGPKKEFRIAKDPYGLADLEFSLVSNWDFVRHNTAIHDFMNYSQILSREGGMFKKAGKDFSRMLDVDFMRETEKYIDSIVDFKYYGETLLHNYNSTAKELFFKKVRSKLKIGNKKLMYFSKLEEREFLLKTNLYIDSIFSHYATKNNLKKILLNQAIPLGNISQTIRYFNHSKLIIVDRDPRDIYTTMMNEKRLLGADLKDPAILEKYLIWHKAVRAKSSVDIKNAGLKKNILNIYFESFFTDYDRTLLKIKKFLDIDFDHSEKGVRFSPENMKEHVGIWRGAKDQNAIARIGEELNIISNYNI